MPRSAALRDSQDRSRSLKLGCRAGGKSLHPRCFQAENNSQALGIPSTHKKHGLGCLAPAKSSETPPPPPFPPKVDMEQGTHKDESSWWCPRLPRKVVGFRAWAFHMVPSLPRFKGSELWALGLYRAYKGYRRGPLLRAHTRSPCSYPKIQGCP